MFCSAADCDSTRFPKLIRSSTFTDGTFYFYFRCSTRCAIIVAAFTALLLRLQTGEFKVACENFGKNVLMELAAKGEEYESEKEKGKERKE